MNCEDFCELLRREGFGFYSGVPDSTLKSLISYIEDKDDLFNVRAVNECEAVAVCTGYHFATGKIGVVYMQNSGEGKTVNPLTSLCDPEVYSIPVLLMIGWRGGPGTKDEPQHVKMGRVTIPLLETLEISYKILPDNIEEAEKVIQEMKEKAEETKSPVAIIIKKGLFEEYEAKEKVKTNYEMKREDAIKAIIDNLDSSEAIISTTGKTSRELFEYRIGGGEKPRDFYTVGSMGCSASIANSIALQKSGKKVFVFDGDGAVIMQMGALATIGHYKAKNLYHIVFDNAAHDSTGGQPTVSDTINFE